jgi:5'-3' exonuclease
MSRKRVLLLDGDIFAFQAAAATEQEVDFGESPSMIYLCSSIPNAIAHAKEKVQVIAEALGADELVFFLTDKLNWRQQLVDPTYKSNRKKVRKPLGLVKIREALFKYYRSELEPSLEADDLMGIRATDPDYYAGWEKIIVSIDKDMRTIPSGVYNPSKDFKVQNLTEAQADLWFFTQAIAGDITDGYKGCQGIGTERAAGYLTDMLGVKPYEHTFKSGKRKGDTEIRHETVPMDNMWDIALSLYLKAGMSEADAYKNHRCARILRHGEYDFKAKKVKLWTPDT